MMLKFVNIFSDQPRLIVPQSDLKIYEVTTLLRTTLGFMLEER